MCSQLLTKSYNAYEGVSADLFEDETPSAEELTDMLADGAEASSNVLEMAILSEAKAFIATPLIQSIISELAFG